MTNAFISIKETISFINNFRDFQLFWKLFPFKIINNFFGESITVAGLLTGRDIKEQLLCKALGEELLIPEAALRHGEEVFLCDMTVSELSASLGVKVTPVGDGYDLFSRLLGR